MLLAISGQSVPLLANTARKPKQSFFMDVKRRGDNTRLWQQRHKFRKLNEENFPTRSQRKQTVRMHRGKLINFFHLIPSHSRHDLFVKNNISVCLVWLALSLTRRAPAPCLLCRI